MLPNVVLHNQISLDGRLDWFPADIGLHYQIASNWKFDAHLAGSDTILKMTDQVPPEQMGDPIPPKPASDETRPVLVIPDSRGRIRTWNYLRAQPFWSDAIALCSESTDDQYIRYLNDRQVEYIVTGTGHVDLRQALAQLKANFDMQQILCDSGGTLNGQLLRQNLATEISLLVCPYLVGGDSTSTIYRASDLHDPSGVMKLELIALEKLDNDVIWMRYKIPNSQK